MVGFELAVSEFLTTVTPDTYVLYKTPTILQTLLPVMGKITKRKKTPTTELNIFLSSFLRRKIKTKYFFN